MKLTSKQAYIAATAAHAAAQQCGGNGGEIKRLAFLISARRSGVAAKLRGACGMRTP